MNKFRIVKDDLDEKAEEVEIYKDRLQEMETAFRYNLSLLSERDMELDLLEEQLRGGIVQLERLTQEKAIYEDLMGRLEEEKTKEIKLLKDKLLSREKEIREIERKNEANVMALKKKLEDVKQEQSGEHAKLEKEKIRLEKYYVRAIQFKEAEHAEEISRIKRKYVKQMDEIAKQRHRFETIRAENKKLKKWLVLLQKEKEEREKCYADRIKQSNQLYERVKEKLGNVLGRMETKSQVDTKATMTGCEARAIATQTINRGEIDREEFAMIREQNDVLKSIIKNLKRSKGCCQECFFRKEETNKKMESEVNDLRKALERERCRRSEEEAIIQNLETGVVCLKEKLLASLRRDTNYDASGFER